MRRRKLDKNKIYAFIGRATTKITAFILTEIALYYSLIYVLDNCITVYKQKGGRKMFTRKDRKIRNLEAMIENRNTLIADLQDKIEMQKKENLALYDENKDLRFENEEQKDFIDRLDRLINSNKYNNEKSILNKTKELVHDYQSINQFKEYINI